MVFVKVRETYDLHTVKNKMTLISIHTPHPNIIKRNYPGLLMQCRAYRPVSADVRIACASSLPLDPQGVGTSTGDVAPEDVFNPILYKAISNKGMSQLEARISYLSQDAAVGTDVIGDTANVDVDTNTSSVDEFPIYYGLLADTNGWKHANPQAGLSMSSLKPYVYELNYNVGDQLAAVTSDPQYRTPDADGSRITAYSQAVLGKAKEFPFLNCTSYSFEKNGDVAVAGTYEATGFPPVGSGPHAENFSVNTSVDVPYLNVCVAGIIIPPSRLHELFYRMVVEWTIEFSAIRSIGEITDWYGLSLVGSYSHYQNYSYSATKEAITGSSDSIMDHDTCMVSANVDVNKVM